MFVSVFFGVSDLYQNNRNKQNCFETNRNNPKILRKHTKICSLSNCFGFSSVCFSSIETSKLYRNSICFGIEAKQPKQTVSKQTEKYEKNEKTEKNEKIRENNR